MRHRPLLLFFEDEARFGRISNVQACWVPPDKVPGVARAMVREFIYAFTAVAPQKGICYSMIAPQCNTICMQTFLNHLSQAYHRYRMVVLLDKAGWHLSGSLRVPQNIVLLSLPPYAPQLNPVELVWREIRQKHVNNKVIKNLDAVENTLAKALHYYHSHPHAVKKLTAFPWIPF